MSIARKNSPKPKDEGLAGSSRGTLVASAGGGGDDRPFRVANASAPPAAQFDPEAVEQSIRKNMGEIGPNVSRESAIAHLEAIWNGTEPPALVENQSSGLGYRVGDPELRNGFASLNNGDGIKSREDLKDLVDYLFPEKK